MGSCQWAVGRKNEVCLLPTAYRPLMYGYSVVKHQKKRSGYSGSPIGSRVTAPKNYPTRMLAVLSMFRERERRSRCIKLVVPYDRRRSVWADNSSDRAVRRHTQRRPDTAADVTCRLYRVFQLCVSNCGSFEFPPKKSSPPKRRRCDTATAQKRLSSTFFDPMSFSGWFFTDDLRPRERNRGDSLAAREVIG